MKEDLHVKILKYGALKRDEGFTYNELKKDLNLTDRVSRFLYNEIRGADIVTSTGEYRIPDNTDSGNEILILSFEARFKLLQYTALQEARLASFIAIAIATIALIVTSHFSQIQATPVLQNLAKETRTELTFCLQNADSDYQLLDGSTTTCKTILRQRGYLLDQEFNLSKMLGNLPFNTTSVAR